MDCHSLGCPGFNYTWLVFKEVAYVALAKVAGVAATRKLSHYCYFCLILHMYKRNNTVAN